MNNKIYLKYELNGQIKEFVCDGWSIYNSWMPSSHTKPLLMTIRNNGVDEIINNFDLIHAEKFGIDYVKILPKK